MQALHSGGEGAEQTVFGEPSGFPNLVSVKERWQSGVSQRAAEVQSSHLALHRAYDARDGSAAANNAWARAATAFQSAVTALYAPYDELLAGVRAGRLNEIEEATRFLVADPWCFRSGYLKAELMHGLANTLLPSHVVEPLRGVVLRRIVNPQPRLLRYAAQLAANLWDEAFEAEVRRIELTGSAEERLAAARLSAAAHQRIRSLADRPSEAGPAGRPQEA